MKKLLAGLMVFGFLFIGAQQAHASLLGDLKVQIIALKNELISLKSLQKASALNIVSTGDITPRVMFWSGKVNQHVDSDGAWQTDSDGSSGAGIDKLTYCQKFYPNTLSTESYQNETISTWRDAGNANAYTSTRLSYKCVEQQAPVAIPSITVTSPNGGEVYQAGQQITVKWNTENIPNSNKVIIILDSLSTNYDGYNMSGSEGTINDGSQTYSLAGVLVTGQYKVRITAENSSGNTIAQDSSDNLFTINSSNNVCLNGATNYPTCTINTPSITVNSPNGGENYNKLDTFNIKWKYNGLITSKDTVKIILKDISNNWIYTMCESCENSGLASLKLTDNWNLVLGNRYKISVRVTDSTGFVSQDESDNSFTIKESTTEDGCKNGEVYSSTTGQKCPTNTPSITVTSPNGGETWSYGNNYTITWKAQNIDTDLGVSLGYSNDEGGTSYCNLGRVSSSTRSYTFKLTQDTPCPNFSSSIQPGQYKVHIYMFGVGLDSFSDDSDNPFTINSSNNVCLNGATNYPTCTITTPSITVLSPNGGEVYQAGQQITVKWESKNVGSTVIIGMQGKSGFDINDAFSKITNVTVPNTGSATYILPNSSLFYSSGGLIYNQPIYYIAVYLGNVQDISDNTFTIKESITEDGCKNGEVYSSTDGQKCPAGNTPIISGVSGPQTLNINQTGTWTVSASDPSGGNLSYSVNWNDSSTFACQSGSACTSSSIQYQQSATFTHKYTNTSIYNPTFTVTNSSGQSAKTSLSVVVGSSIYPSGCNAFTGYSNTTGLDCGCWSTSGYSLSTGQSCGIATPSITVTSPNGGENIKAGDKYNITWKYTEDFSDQKVSLSLKKEGVTCPPAPATGCQSEFNIAYGIANKGAYTWDTNLKMSGPSTGPNSISVASGEKYRIKICNQDGTICDDSDNYFTINSSNNVCTNGATNYPTCTTTSTLPVGCTSTYGYSPVTGMKCDGLQNVITDFGCLPGNNFSSTTGRACVITTPYIETDTTPIIRTLKLTNPRMTGKDVMALQSYLGLIMDGVYGSGTMAKVAEWQLEHDLNPDGTVGAETRNKMGL